jgi:putative serine protease PepD
VKTWTIRALALAAALVAAALLGAAIAAHGGTNQVERTQAVQPPAAALSLQNAFVKVVNAVSPAVVQIETSSGLGSGVVFDTKGDIVTNYHVVGSARQFVVTTAKGQRTTATLVGTFPQDDLAVIRAASTAGFKAAQFADSSKLRVGDIAIAIGNPLGLTSSVTEGIVSALGRTVSEPTGAAIPDAIQTSAPINPGNSGGALVDVRGRVIGIPTLAATSGLGAAPGIGFAIPSNTVKDIATQLIQNGKVVNSHRAYLGVRVGDTLGTNGVYVGEVTAGGPAAKAGIEVGDTIVSVAGKPTPSSSQLTNVLAPLKPGQTVKVGIVHQDGTQVTVSVTLGEYPG